MSVISRMIGGCLLAASLLHAQGDEFRFDHLTLQDGLSQSQVAAILQDRVGFMWFGTREGLNRYDGYDFVIHKSNPDDPSTISDNFVTDLCESRHGENWEIWAGTRAGLNRFDPRTNRFTRYFHDPGDPGSISDNLINVILEDDQGRLWVGTRRGLNLGLPPADPEEPYRFVHYRHREDDPATLSHDHVTALWNDRRASGKIIWVGTHRGLNRLEVQPREGTLIPDVEISRNPLRPPEGNGPNRAAIQTLYQSGEGTLWVATRGGYFYGVETFSHKVRRYRIEVSDAVRTAQEITAFQEHDGLLWVGTFGSGIHLLDLKDGSRSSLRQETSNPTSIAGDFILSFHRDRAGRLWIASSGNGISLYFKQKRHFTNLGHEPLNPNSLSHRSVLSVFENVNGDVWVGTVKGLNRVDAKTGAVQQFRQDPSDSSSLSKDIIYALEAVPGTRGEALWVGTLQGLVRLDLRRRRITRFQHDPANPRSLQHNRVQSILADRHGRTWVGTDRGISRFEPTIGLFQNYTRVRDDPESPAGERVSRLFEDSRGLIWIATNQGVSRFDPEMGRFTNYDTASSGLSDDMVYSFCESHGETGQILWIGTRNGLSKFEVDRGRWTRYFEADGLPSAVVLGVLPDRAGHLWLSTFRGLSRFDPKTETFQNFGPADGLQSYEFNWGAYHRGRSGRLYFGGILGLNWFDPGSLVFNLSPPPVVLTSLRVFNREIALDQALPLLRNIELSHDQNSLSFEFAALDYTAPDQNRYAYRMEGVDLDWVDAGRRRYASYTELKPGNYRFRVKGSNNDGVWNEEGVVLDIRIHPPIWRTRGAYLLYALAISGLVVAVERARTRRLKLSAELRVKRFESQKLAELDRLKTRFFTDITHELRTPLTLIQGSMERLSHPPEGGTQDLDRIRQNTGKLVSLIDQLLDLARLEAGKMVFKPEVQDLADFSRFVVSSFAPLAESRGIHLSCNTPRTAVLINFDREQLEKCLSNLLTNALKFTPSGGRVSVRLRENSEGSAEFPGSCAEIEVEDTGVGIPEGELERVFDRFYQARKSNEGCGKGSGVGLALTRQLVVLHGGVIRAHGRPGARFTVRLPLAPAEPPGEITQEASQDLVPVTDFSSETPRPGSAAAVSPPERGKRERPEVLVVDDHPDMRCFLREALESDYTVDTANLGVEAFERAVHSPPDLIVSDVMMPGLDGIQLCRHLRKDERTSHIPIILLTARTGRHSRIVGLETGADAYLTKPFSAKELRSQIRNLIVQREQLREKYSRRIQLDPGDITIASTDELFLRRVMQIVEEQLSNFDFSVAELASRVGLSRVQLHRKIRALTGESPSEFIRTTRLRLAARLLARGGFNVTQVAYEVGFNNLSYFAKCFRERFGISPSVYAKDPTKEVQT